MLNLTKIKLKLEQKYQICGSLCLDTIESMCKAFIWSRIPNDTHKVKFV